eukprot:XP_762832.1 hypothetical protein [Theileria parva strain Muguga]
MDCVQDPGDLFSTKLISSGKGNGIILLKDLKASESKLQDKPIFSYTHYYSREGKYVSPELEAKINSFKHQFP